MIKNILAIGLFFLVACSSSHKYSSETFGIEKPPRIYVVKKGDTLFSIAWRYGLERAEVQRRNSIIDPNKIFIGQRLRLIPQECE